MRIKFESVNGLPLGEILNIPLCVVITRSVFEDNDKFYPQVYLEPCYLEYEHEHAGGSYVYCRAPLKSMNSSEYGQFLFKRHAVNFVTTDFDSTVC